MAVKTVDTEHFLELSKFHPILDVRSPGEFSHAHIPGAFSFPLFSDDERKVVGTSYKQVSRQEAIKIGLEYFGPKMRTMVENAEFIAKNSGNNTLLIHCWRGGMRSAAIAWLMNLYGFDVYLLAGGYKAFRKWVLTYFEENQLPLIVIGGYTGSGKTEVLQALQSKGELVIDLEDIAGHRGSAFGNLGLPDQPGVEQVENNLAIKIKNTKFQLSSSENKWVWVENESRRIGNVNLPVAFYDNLKNAPYLSLKVPFEVRLDTILKNYGNFPIELLENAILRIRKRMGNDQNGMAIKQLKDNNIRGCFEILLSYYDKYYNKSSSMNGRKPMEIDLKSYLPEDIADYLIEKKDILNEFRK
jgi:tRNA 2-selenouridine synthase